MTNFIHLRCHSNYSVGEGSIRVSDISAIAKNFNMPALGICDSNNMFGVREFSDKVSQKGIKPLIGMQLDVIYTTQAKKTIEGQMVFLCKNHNGYKNLLKIHDKAYIYKATNNLDSAKIEFKDVLEHANNLILLTAGINGLLAKLIPSIKEEELTLFINLLKKSFHEDLYIELNRLNNIEEDALEEQFLKLAIKHEIPIVATNNVLFNQQEDYNANDILICIGKGYRQDSEDRIKISKEQYFKSSESMIELFKDLPEAIENTVNIAKKCNFFVDKSPLLLPKFSDNEETLIKEYSYEGLRKRLNNEVYPKIANLADKEAITKIYTERLNFELEVIIKMNFAGYFLIVSDFIKWAKNNNIPVGPGRGSGAGSIVAWCLFITDINPMQFNLLFERFLNPERISMPDFDIDFCQDRRDEVIEYVRSKYGKDKVAHIITFGTLQARAAIKDVGRAMGLPYSEVDVISKKIPYSPPSNPTNLSKIINEVDAIKEEMREKEHINELFNISLKLEGLYRNTSTHAAGVVISKEPLNDIVPLFYDDASLFPSVGFSMKYIEDVGLIKFDFLALTTLTIIKNTIDMIKKNKGQVIDILQIDYMDKNISKLISNGDTLGVFQMESMGMTDIIKQLKPDKIEDIIAIISLYRPGPIENIPVYIDRKHGKEKVAYLHPKMETILEETFGIMIYQEQVMEVAKIIAGYTLGSADILRRAMGKKDPKEMAKQKEIFIKGAKEYSNIDEVLASEIFDQMEKFAGYGFNKSHATAYALITWQTAYLKAYYPAEFLASSMTADINSNNKGIERFLEFLEEAKKFNIKILPPSVNYSFEEFSIEKCPDNTDGIRYSLLAIKGVGSNTVAEIKKEREKNGNFTSMEDFLTRLDNKLLNKKQLESFIKSGSFDDLHKNRNELLENIENLINFNSNVFSNKNSNQIGLFDLDSSDVVNILQISPKEDFSFNERMIEELSVMGCFLSGHPLNEYSEILSKINLKTYTEVIEKKFNGAFIAGFLMKIKLAKSKNNTNFANLTLYDKSSVFSLSLFGDLYSKLLFGLKKIEEGKSYIIKTTIKVNDEEVRLFVESMEELEKDYKIKKSQLKEPSSIANNNLLKASENLNNADNADNASNENGTNNLGNIGNIGNLDNIEDLNNLNNLTNTHLEEMPYYYNNSEIYYENNLDIPNITANITNLTSNAPFENTLEPVASKNIIITLNNVEELTYLNNILYPQQHGTDILVIKIPKNNQYMVFDVHSIKINYEHLSMLKNKNIKIITNL